MRDDGYAGKDGIGGICYFKYGGSGGEREGKRGRQRETGREAETVRTVRTALGGGSLPLLGTGVLSLSQVARRDQEVPVEPAVSWSDVLLPTCSQTPTGYLRTPIHNYKIKL